MSMFYRLTGSLEPKKSLLVMLIRLMVAAVTVFCVRNIVNNELTINITIVLDPLGSFLDALPGTIFVSLVVPIAANSWSAGTYRSFCMLGNLF